ncbi:MAG: hypothetical protein LBH61_05710 [Dysgonamonadaceae bacterium]|jgi:hypothetical protein|nr:hypothetical protein [Dysgonamonadaceae bacterium]
MKNFVLAIVLLTVLASCDKYTNVTETIEPLSFTRKITVYREDWRKSQKDENNPGDYHFYQVQEPKLTDYIFDRGVMQAFLLYNADNRDTMSPLPYSDFVINGNQYIGEEHFTVEFQPGWVTFVMKSDFNAGLPYYDSYEFIVRFLW